MARLRTVKPEFWTSEQVMECSPITRLLFIGLWNFCDDGGNHPASSVTLRAEVFPGDKHQVSTDDVKKCIAELTEYALIFEYEKDSKRYWHVTGWRHQKIDKPTFKYPQPNNQVAIAEDSGSNQVAIADPSLLRGEESSGVESSGVESRGVERSGEIPIAIGKPNCPHQEIINLYHELLPANPCIKDWTAARKGMLKARWDEDSERQNLQYWRGLFEYISRSKFLTGRADKSNGRPFLPSLAWMIKAENFAKIREGNYEEKSA